MLYIVDQHCKYAVGSEVVQGGHVRLNDIRIVGRKDTAYGGEHAEFVLAINTQTHDPTERLLLVPGHVYDPLVIHGLNVGTVALVNGNSSTSGDVTSNDVARKRITAFGEV